MADETTSRTGQRTYRGLSNREQTGWVLGVTPLQAVGCVLLAAPILVALPAGDWAQTLLWLAVDGPLVILVLVPVRGRPALRWLANLLAFPAGALTPSAVLGSPA